ncbi:hypothetical protein ACEPUD_18435 [Burkholderia ubonensis]|uniref:hypothetical protein n=1 Tax=Burkholderia ubonensis TaxID=101571 RepID=UPI003590181E
MSIIDPTEVTQTTDRLYQGAYLNTAVHFFETYVIQILNQEQNGLHGTHAKSGSATRTVDIATPHGDVVLTSEHGLMAGELVARLTFTSVRQELDKRVAGRELLTVVIKSNSDIVRIGNSVLLHKIGSGSIGNRIIEEIVILMLSKLQNDLPVVQ